MNKIVSTTFYTPSVAPRAAPAAAAPAESFQAILGRALREPTPLRFSAHAQDRLADRSLRLDGPELGRVAAAVDRAADKGARNALVVGDRYALIVNVPSRVVVTALQRDGMKEQVVTNIDSTVFV
jgi:flagellar operon protein